MNHRSRAFAATSRRPTSGRFVLVGAMIGAVALPGAAAAAPAPTIGGFELKAQSSVVTIQLYERTIPMPADPQGELDLAYTRSTLGTGPDGRGTASWIWPGDAIGDGFGTIVGDPNQKWPSQVNARTPNGPAEEKQELTPGSGMRSEASADAVRAKVNLVGLAAPKETPSPPGMEVLFAAEGISSSTEVTVKGGVVGGVARTAAKNIALLGGLITIDAVTTRTLATSTATNATADGVATVTGVTVAGKKLGIDSKGVRLADQGAEVPRPPAELTKQLKALGIEVTPLSSSRSVKGGTGSLSASGLTITIDTKPLRSKLDTSPLNPILDLIPPELRDQVNLALALAPKIVYVIGEAKTTAAATGPASVPDVPAVPPGAPDGGLGAGDAPGAGDQPGGGAPGDGDNPVRRAGADLPPLGAIPRLLLLGALVTAAAVGWALQRAGTVMLAGAASCDHGLVSGVPDLRKGR